MCNMNSRSEIDLSSVYPDDLYYKTLQETEYILERNKTNTSYLGNNFALNNS